VRKIRRMYIVLLLPRSSIKVNSRTFPTLEQKNDQYPYEYE
jgi:hypothetical protein